MEIVGAQAIFHASLRTKDRELTEEKEEELNDEGKKEDAAKET